MLTELDLGWGSVTGIKPGLRQGNKGIGEEKPASSRELAGDGSSPSKESHGIDRGSIFTHFVHETHTN